MFRRIIKRNAPAYSTLAADSASNIRIDPGRDTFYKEIDLNKRLLAIIIARAVIFLAGINLSDRLGLLPEQLGTFEFSRFFNILTVLLTILYLVLWRFWRALRPQLYFQILADLVLATILVASTSGIEGPFVSFYLLIIIYCSITLGKNGGIVSAALSAICHSGIVVATFLGIVGSQRVPTDMFLEVFKIGSHVLGFGAVAYLGTSLNRRLYAMGRVLDERSESLAQLYRWNDHIVSSIRSGLITTDLGGRVTVFNAAAGEMMGISPGEALGTSIRGIIGGKFWDIIRESGLFRSMQSMRHEDWIRLADGSMRFFGFTVSPLFDADNRRLGFIVSFQDLSEIARLEKEVRRRERLAAVGRMAAVVAHEIRNPLTAMRGSVEMLRTRANLPEKDERLLNILISESDRLNSFIEDFLNFAMPKPRPKTVLDLVSVLGDSVTLMENSPEIKEKYSVSLDIKVSGMFVLGNADQIRQVFWNLAQNAMRAMPDGGNLAIQAYKNRDGAGEVIFSDNGVGMTQDETEQMFQPFYSGFSKGLGLGLSIVFQIMEDHNGRISFESEKGSGTKVILSFPLEAAMPDVGISGLIIDKS